MVDGIRLHGGTVLFPAGSTAEADVTTRAGRVVGGSDASRHEPALDVTGKVILPGLVNVHDHLRSLLPATRSAETLPLPAVVERAAAASAAATPEHYQALSALGAARMVLAGVTSVIDHIYPVHVPGMIEAAAAGHASVGLRASLAVGLMDSGHPAVLQDPETTITTVAKLADDALPAERFFLAPVSLRQASLDVYRAAVAGADRLGMRLYTHIAESADEVAACEAEHGMRPVELLHSIGFLRPGTVLVHCVHLNERERELLAETGTAVAYCPSNHLRFAKGFAPVRELRDLGVAVGLGVDGMTDVFAEMRQAVYAQSSAHGSMGVLSSAEAFQMATSGAAPIIGVDGLTSDLAIGDRADAVVVGLNRPELQPVADPLWTLVHRAVGTDVTDVFVDGIHVVRDRQLTLIDQHDLVERATAAMTAIASAAGINPAAVRNGRSHPHSPQ